MPELPEVETVRQSLLPHLPGQVVTGVRLTLPKLIKYPDASSFVERVQGLSFCDVERRGKYLKFPMSENQSLVIHLRMTGQLRFMSASVPAPAHTHLIFEFPEGVELRFTDIRQFGAIYLADHDVIDTVSGIDRLGFEPLEDFPLDDFVAYLSERKAKIKGLLLNQQLIAGIGNIYADEALYWARIHPGRPASSLSKEEVAGLHAAIREVLQSAIRQRGTSFSDYVDGLGQQGGFQAQLAVYGRGTEPCPSCGQSIVREKICGRGTHFCPACQPFS